MNQLQTLLFNENAITIYGTNENPLFCASQIGDLFDLKKINNSLKDYSDNQKIMMNIQTTGGIQSKVFLTERGLYKFLFTSRKKFAIKFQEWVFDVIEKIRINGKYELKENKSSQPDIENLFCKLNKIEIRSKTLIEANKNTKVVYVCEVDKKINGFPIIKIGKTDNVTERLQALIAYFGINMNYVYVFRCEKNYEFEQFLFNTKTLKDNRYIDSFENGKKSKEMFLLSNDLTYEKLKKIILDNIGPFEKISIEDKLEHKKLDFEIKKMDHEIISKSVREKELEIEIFKLRKEIEDIKFANKNNSIIDEIRQIKDMLKKSVEPKIEIPMHDEIVKKSSSPYIQKYNDKLELIGHYDSFINFTRQNPGTSDHGLKCAIQNNSIYHGFRWALVDKTQNPTIPQNLDPTKEISQKKYELLAHINLSRDRILKVYSEYGEMAKEYKASNSAIASARRRQTKCNGGYVVFYNDCSNEMKEEYELNNTLPIKPISKTGKMIRQIDPASNLEVSTYSCISDITKKFHFGREKLKEAIDKKFAYKGFKWEFV